MSNADLHLENEAEKAPAPSAVPRETGLLRASPRLKQAAASSPPAPRTPMAIGFVAIKWLDLGQLDPSTLAPAQGGQEHQDPTLTMQREFHPVGDPTPEEQSDG